MSLSNVVLAAFPGDCQLKQQLERWDVETWWFTFKKPFANPERVRSAASANPGEGIAGLKLPMLFDYCVRQRGAHVSCFEMTWFLLSSDMFSGRGVAKSTSVEPGPIVARLSIAILYWGVTQTLYTMPPRRGYRYAHSSTHGRPGRRVRAVSMGMMGEEMYGSVCGHHEETESPPLPAWGYDRVYRSCGGLRSARDASKANGIAGSATRIRCSARSEPMREHRTTRLESSDRLLSR